MIIDNTDAEYIFIPGMLGFDSILFMFFFFSFSSKFLLTKWTEQIVNFLRLSMHKHPCQRWLEETLEKLDNILMHRLYILDLKHRLIVDFYQFIAKQGKNRVKNE